MLKLEKHNTIYVFQAIFISFTKAKRRFFPFRSFSGLKEILFAAKCSKFMKVGCKLHVQYHAWTNLTPLKALL